MSVVIDGSAGVTTNSGAVYNGIQAGTAVASTSGTSIDFTGIPSWVKRITVMCNSVSTNGTANGPVFQLGTVSGIETTGYWSNSTYMASGTVATLNTTNGFTVYQNGASQGRSGIITLTLLGSNLWVGAGVFADSVTAVTFTIAGQKTLSGTLDRIRMTTANGTDAFDAGSINILYE
jgi:hypothetical protein